MLSYTDIILSVMQRVEVYNEIFDSVSKEVQENNCNQARIQRKKDTYLFCRNNVNRFFAEEATLKKTLDSYPDNESTRILLEGLNTYKSGIFFWFDALSEQCEVSDHSQYKRGLQDRESSFTLINQACKAACGGIETAHSVHKI